MATPTNEPYVIFTIALRNTVRFNMSVGSAFQLLLNQELRWCRETLPLVFWSKLFSHKSGSAQYYHLWFYWLRKSFESKIDAEYLWKHQRNVTSALNWCVESLRYTQGLSFIVLSFFLQLSGTEKSFSASTNAPTSIFSGEVCYLKTVFPNTMSSFCYQSCDLAIVCQRKKWNCT